MLLSWRRTEWGLIELGRYWYAYFSCPTSLRYSSAMMTVDVVLLCQIRCPELHLPVTWKHALPIFNLLKCAASQAPSSQSLALDPNVYTGPSNYSSPEAGMRVKEQYWRKIMIASPIYHVSRENLGEIGYLGVWMLNVCVTPYRICITVENGSVNSFNRSPNPR